MRMRMRRQQKQVSRWLTHTTKTHTHTLARTTVALENFLKSAPGKMQCKKQQQHSLQESTYTHTHIGRSLAIAFGAPALSLALSYWRSFFLHVWVFCS